MLTGSLTANLLDIYAELCGVTQEAFLVQKAKEQSVDCLRKSGGGWVEETNDEARTVVWLTDTLQLERLHGCRTVQKSSTANKTLKHFAAEHKYEPVFEIVHLNTSLVRILLIFSTGFI